MNNALFPVESWSVFQRPHRTNNHVEGWHRRLNSLAKGNSLNMYKLIGLLHQEAKDVSLTCRFIREGRLHCYQKPKYANHHRRVHEIWEQFANGDLPAKQLLKKCAHVDLLVRKNKGKCLNF